MRGTLIVFTIIMLGTAAAVEAQPPGAADVTISRDAGGEIVIAIQSAEGGNTGKITCGNAQRCRPNSSIRWSIQNNIGSTVDVELAGWNPSNPFPRTMGLNNVQAGQQRPLNGRIKSDVAKALYKYDIIVKDQDGNEIGRLDPEIDIMN